MEQHARIFESEKLNKQILVYIDYDGENNSHSIIYRLPFKGGKAEINVGGIESLQNAKDILNNRTLKNVEAFIEETISMEILDKEEE